MLRTFHIEYQISRTWDGISLYHILRFPVSSIEMLAFAIILFNMSIDSLSTTYKGNITIIQCQ